MDELYCGERCQRTVGLKTGEPEAGAKASWVLEMTTYALEAGPSIALLGVILTRRYHSAIVLLGWMPASPAICLTQIGQDKLDQYPNAERHVLGLRVNVNAPQRP